MQFIHHWQDVRLVRSLAATIPNTSFLETLPGVTLEKLAG